MKALRSGGRQRYIMYIIPVAKDYDDAKDDGYWLGLGLS